MTESFVAQSKRPLVLADRLRADGYVLMSGKNGTEKVPFPRSMFAGHTPVVLDAVSDWWDVKGVDKWPDDRLDPNYRLPWPAVWAEWQERNPQLLSQWEQKGMTGPIHRGWMLREMGPRADMNARDMLLAFERSAGMPLQMPPNDRVWDEARVLLLAQEFTAYPQGVVATPYMILPVREDGRPNGGDGRGNYYVVVGGPPVPEFQKALWDDFGIWRLFTALLSVKNIAAVDVDLPRADRRRAARQAIADKGPPPWVRYKTLAITLPSQGESTDSASGGPASPVPFHLVRGHLADYRQGRGLFGKFRTVVWVPMHSRGFQRAGAIAKTYESKIAVTADPFATRTEGAA